MSYTHMYYKYAGIHKIYSYMRILFVEQIEKFTSYSFEKEEKRGENQAPLLSEAEEEFAKRYKYL